MKDFSGFCLCGAVQFTFGPPSLWCAHCHCSLCRRAHGAAFVTWIGVDQKRFELIRQDTLRWYRSSAEAQRGFCATCGSTLFFRSERWPGEIHVAHANVESEIDLAPSAHAFWESHVDWFEFDDPLPRKTSG